MGVSQPFERLLHLGLSDYIYDSQRPTGGSISGKIFDLGVAIHAFRGIKIQISQNHYF